MWCIMRNQSSSGTVYNTALAKHMFWLANALDLFARGLQAEAISLFECTFPQQFSLMLALFKTYLSPKI